MHTPISQSCKRALYGQGFYQKGGGWHSFGSLLLAASTHCKTLNKSSPQRLDGRLGTKQPHWYKCYLVCDNTTELCLLHTCPVFFPIQWKWSHLQASLKYSELGLPIFELRRLSQGRSDMAVGIENTIFRADTHIICK